MTRKKEINKAAGEFLNSQPQDYFKTESERNTAHTGFIMGARWADEHKRVTWIKAEEKMPREGQSVLVLYDDMSIGTDKCVNGDWFWESSMENPNARITHWTFLPKEPTNL